MHDPSLFYDYCRHVVPAIRKERADEIARARQASKPKAKKPSKSVPAPYRERVPEVPFYSL